MVTSLFNLSGGGMSPQEVQAMIDSALTAYTLTQDFATINGSGITEGGNIEINGGEEVVWLQDIDTEKAIEIYANPQRYLIYSGSTENAFNVYRFRRMTGFIAEFCNEVTELNADSTLTLYRKIIWVQEDGTVSHSFDNNFNIVTPNALSTTLSAYTPTANFATINGSGITQGGNITIEGGGIEVVNYNNIDTAKGLEIYANPERYVIDYDGRILQYWQTKNSSYATYKYIYVDGLSIMPTFQVTSYEIQIKSNGGKQVFSGYGGTVYKQTQIDTLLAAKQHTLTAGSGIDITNNVISATGGGGGGYTLPTAGVGDNGVLGGVKVDGETININSNGVISATAGNAVQNLNGITGIWQGTQAQYDALATKDNNVFYIITL